MGKLKSASYFEAKIVDSIQWKLQHDADDDNGEENLIKIFQMQEKTFIFKAFFFNKIFLFFIHSSIYISTTSSSTNVKAHKKLSRLTHKILCYQKKSSNAWNERKTMIWLNAIFFIQKYIAWEEE